MALRAATSIQHYQEVEPAPETERVLIPAGEPVDESLFTDDELQELKELGAVVEEGDLEKEEDLKKQVQELQAKLDQMTLEREAARVQLPSPGTLYQTDAVTEETVEDDQEEGDPAPGNARPAVVGGDALAAAGSSKVVKDGEVKSPVQNKQQK
jgi:hypothetical protein